MINQVEPMGFYDYGEQECHQAECFCPQNSCEVYGLAIRLERIVLDDYYDIVDCDSIDDAGGKMLKILLEQQEKEIAALDWTLKFELNQELTKFYNSGGLTEMSGIEFDKLSDDISKVERAFDNFNQRISYCVSKEKQVFESEEKFDNTELLENCLDERRAVSDLLNFLYELYPDGKVKKELLEIIGLVDSGTRGISELCMGK